METDSLFCKICSYQFGKKLVYDIHMSFVHKIDFQQNNSEKLIVMKNEDDTLMGKVDSPKSDEHSLEQTNQSNDLQQEDKSSAPNQLNLNMQIDAVHTKIKSHMCSICNYSFSQKKSLKEDIESVHERKKPHNCSICSYTFAKKLNLQKHIESVHARIKPHKCPICDFSSAYKQSLETHIESIHDRIKPHKCSICDYSTAHKKDLKEKSHISAWFVVILLQKKQNLKVHIHSVHGRKKPNKCSICDFSTAQSNQLKDHVKLYQSTL